MEIYKQTDSRWSWMGLGHNSPYTYKCRDWGSECVAIAQSLHLAGWNITPANVIGRLTDLDGFTDETYYLGPGLVKYEVVQSIFPQFHFGGQGYSIIRGSWGRYNHSLLEAAGSVYDPYYGTQQPPSGFYRSGYIRTASIDPHIQS